MKSSTWMYIAAGVLLLVSLCFLGYGGLNLVGSFDPVYGDPSWRPLGIGLICVGLILTGGGVALVVSAVRKARQGHPQQVTLQIDLPGETKIEAMKCRSCGGTLTADAIKLVNGAPMVNCPYCGTVYQLTEEPKW